MSDNCSFSAPYTAHNVIGSPYTDLHSDLSPKKRLRDSNVVYALIYDFYNQLYNYGPYESKDTVNEFRALNYDSIGMDDFITNHIGKLLYKITSYKLEEKNILTEKIKPIFKLPDVEINNDICTFTFYLNWVQTVDFKKSTNKDVFINNMANQFFRDNEGAISVNGRSPQTTENPEFMNANMQLIKAVDLSEYDIVSDILLENFTPTNFPTHIFGISQVTAQVKKWSPMLIIFMNYKNPVLDYSPNMCGQITNDTYLIPNDCFTKDCALGQVECRKDLDNYCNIAYTPPYPYKVVKSGKGGLMNIASDNCKCYNSGLVPINAGIRGGNLTAMCFDKNCSDEMRQLFAIGAGTTECSNKCEELSSWKFASGNNKMRNESEMDKQRVEKICGLNLGAYQDASFNKSVLVNGIVLTVMLGLLTFSLCKHKEYQPLKISIIVGFIVLISSVLTLFLSRFLAGKYYCDSINNKAIPSCDTNIDFGPLGNLSNKWKKQLPMQFCELQMNCECVSSSTASCPGGCDCFSGTCIPGDKPRKTRQVKESHPNKIIVFTSAIISVLFPIILIYLYKDFHWGISSRTFYAIVVTLSIISISITLYLNFRKITRDVFEDECCAPKCLNKTCGSDECGGTCGECIGQVCCNDNCFDRKIGDDCVNFQKGCPLIAAKDIFYDIKSLLSGNYKISWVDSDSQIYYLYPDYSPQMAGVLWLVPEQNGQPRNERNYWTFDKKNMSLLGETAGTKMISPVAQDGDNICGNPATGEYGGAISFAFVEDNPLYNRFILASETIFSVDANAYIIPDTNIYSNPDRGRRIINGIILYSLTYTSDIGKAKVWRLQKIN